MARFVYRCHMRWGDMDAYAHVNNTAYVTYLEQARVAMFFDRYDANFARGTVIARHEITYLRPVVYHPEPLRLELWVEEVRAASFQVRYEVFDGDVLVARAATRCVPFDFATDRPRRITADERVLLRSFADDGGPEITEEHHRGSKPVRPVAGAASATTPAAMQAAVSAL